MSTHFTAMKCPSCNAPLDVEDTIDTFFCKYCGYKIIMSGQSDAAYHAKTQVKSMEHDEKMADKKYAHEKFKLETKTRREINKMKLGILLVSAMVLLFIMIFASAKLSSNSQERKLQKVVDKIQTDIKNGDFDNAYIKAQSIRYTADWSHDIEKKWDATRIAVINQIIEAEKRTTGSSSHVPETENTDGLLSKVGKELSSLLD